MLAGMIDDHGLELGVVDVGRDDGPASGHLVAYELGRDGRGDGGPEGLARVLLRQRRAVEQLATLVLPDGDELHLGGHDALPSVVHLGDAPSWLRPTGCTHVVEAEVDGGGVDRSLTAVRRRGAIQLLGVATLVDPCGAQGRDALAHVHVDVRVRVRSRRVVDVDGRVLLFAEQRWRVGLLDLAHGHADVRTAPLHVDTPRTGQWLGHLGGQLVRPVVDLLGGVEARGGSVGDCAHDFAP
jgi:hypothetical protein